MAKKYYRLTVYFEADEKVAKKLGFDRPLEDLESLAKIKLDFATLLQESSSENENGEFVARKFY